MAAPMLRGANVDLTREVPTLVKAVVGVRWDAGAERALDEALVMAAVLCDADGRALSPEHFVYFNQLVSPEESVSEVERLLGDDREQVLVDLPTVPPEVERVVVLLFINDGLGARRTLGQLRHCVVRVLDQSGAELVRSEDLAPLLTGETALTLGELYRHSGHWKFKVLGQGYDAGLPALGRDLGLPL